VSTTPPQEGRRRRRSRLWLVLLAGLAVLAAIGIVTTLLGAPCFAWLLRGRRVGALT